MINGCQTNIYLLARERRGTVSKYQILVRILDGIRSEAAGTKWESLYAVNSEIEEDVEQARARAYIHLYLKVMFGLSSFADREQFVTDGSYDGGIDGYYIDRDTRQIHLIQSKFRRTAENFTQKKIDPEEILSMDVDRITAGNETNEAGVAYNGKIKGLIRSIAQLPDAARYSYRVAIIANCELPAPQVRRLTGGYSATVFDYQKTYRDLLFPVVSGTYFRASDIVINIDMENKSAGARTSYSVSTTEFECEITVLFLPTIEIAKIIEKYRNTLLEHNPRSYLELEGQQVNRSIRSTIMRSDSNEFALLNNGLMILSDETNINERVGQHNKAQLRVLNPQIINGGQTAYTLGRIMQENPDQADEIFRGKEVLAKIITLTPKSADKDSSTERSRLIREISEATNRQTPIIGADRISNDPKYLRLQGILFEKYGIFYERKRGEFSDGVAAGYISAKDVLERNLFLRLSLAAIGQLTAARQRKIFQNEAVNLDSLTDETSMDKFYQAFKFFNWLAPSNPNSSKRYREVLTQCYMFVEMTKEEPSFIRRCQTTLGLWEELRELIAIHRPKYFDRVFTRGGKSTEAFAIEKWMVSRDFERDVREFVSTRSLSHLGGKTP